jgi:hypothetical protein|tara:strand:+ start:9136 stop:12075 length:2940 start_codon:yes stop_codon:yes gene_type:complete
MTYPKFTKPTQMKKGGKKKKSSGKPKPTNPSLWSRAKSMARSKFDVYPSAYANAWAAKWYKSKGGGWRGGKKKAAGGSEPKPLTTEEYSKIYEMLKQYFPKQEGVTQEEYGRALNLVIRNVFKDADSLKYTRNLLKNDKLDEILENITSAPILQKALSGEEVGVLEIPGAIRAYFGDRTNPNSVIVQDALKAMGVKPEDAPAYIKEQIRQVGYDAMDPNPGSIGTEDQRRDFDKQLEQNIGLFDFANRGEIYEYSLEAGGGPISYQQGGSQEGDLMRIQNGGTHEESPLGGVPIGKDADGRQVLVEEGETIRKGAEEDFVFSDRLKLTKQEAEEFGLDKKFVGQSFAKISEKIETRSRRRKDPIDQQTIDILLNRLEEAQETFKQRKLAEAKEMYGDPAAEEGPVAPSEGRSGPGEPPTQEEAIAINAMLQQAAMAGQGGMPPQGAPMGGPPPGMMPGPGAMSPGPGPTMMPHGGPHQPGEAAANPLIGMANAGIPPSQLDFDNADTATKERLAAMFPNTYKISADTPTLEDLRVAQSLDPTSGLPTFESLKPGRMKAIKSNPPISQQEFDMLDPRVKAEYVEAFPGVYKISADTPTLQDLQNMQVTTKSHGGAYHNAQGQPVDKDGVLLPPEMFQGERSVFQFPQGTNVDYMSIDPGATSETVDDFVRYRSGFINNPSLVNFSLGRSADEIRADLLSSADADATSMSAATPMGQSLDSGTVTAAGDQGDDDGTPDPVDATSVNAADVAQLTAGQKANVVKVETVVDEKTGEKTIVRTYDDGSTQEFKIPEVDTPKGLTALQAAPIAANIMTSAMLPEKFNFAKYRLPLDDSIIEKRDISPELRDIERMVATGRGAISSRATSTAELLVGLANLTALGMAETGKIRNEQYTDYIAQLQNQQLRNLEISSRNATMQAEVDAANAGLEKERLSLINAAATEASKLADSLRQEGLSKYELEQMYLMYPYLATTQPQTQTKSK